MGYQVVNSTQVFCFVIYSGASECSTLCECLDHLKQPSAIRENLRSMTELIYLYFVDALGLRHMQYLYFVDGLGLRHMQYLYFVDELGLRHMPYLYFVDELGLRHMPYLYCSEK
jgi:hypothetical protein